MPKFGGHSTVNRAQIVCFRPGFSDFSRSLDEKARRSRIGVSGGLDGNYSVKAQCRMTSASLSVGLAATGLSSGSDHSIG